MISFFLFFVSDTEEEEEDRDSMSAAHDPTGIAQGGWREEGAGDKSALNEEMEAETGESVQCIYMTCVFCHM